jgi:antitoxin (DNA-binding transcriptional repressor) of toxin-antitoxin stability system
MKTRWDSELAASSYGGYHRRMRVGTKELKNRLSHYVRRVRAGEVVEITDRGTVVAEIRAVDPTPDEDAALAALEAEGAITRGTGRAGAFRPLKLKKKGVRISDFVVQDRR